MSPIAASVDEFLATVPPDKRAVLEDLRKVIAATAPDATELINYGVPMFRLNGKNLVSYAAGKDHCSFYVQSPAVMDAHADDLKGFATTKGTVHFSPGKPLQAALVTKLVKARIAEIQQRAHK
jgi:uncharacterized protein YdhG (YjbR/CyaY superfamily)